MTMLKLFFTNNKKYKELRRYKKRQRKYRRKLIQLSKKFAPWSGYYMHEMITVMVEFFYKTYLCGDCIYSENERRLDIVKEQEEVRQYAITLESIEEMSEDELLAQAQIDGEIFNSYVVKMLQKCYPESYEQIEGDKKARLTAAYAYSYLVDKYTKAFYESLGKYIWGWSD